MSGICISVSTRSGLDPFIFSRLLFRFLQCDNDMPVCFDKFLKQPQLCRLIIYHQIQKFLRIIQSVFSSTERKVHCSPQYSTGISTRKVLPFPASLSKLMLPLKDLSIFLLIAKSQPGAAISLFNGAVFLGKFFKHFFLLLFRNPYPCIFHLNSQSPDYSFPVAATPVLPHFLPG